MARGRIWPLIVLLIAMGLSLIPIFLFWHTPIGGICAPSSSEQTKQTFDILNQVIDLDLTLCTAIIGLCAAILLGIQAAIRITILVFILIGLAILALSQAIFYAIWWKFAVANLWFDGCAGQLDSPALQNPYIAHFWAMGIGIFFLALLVLAKALERMGDPRVET